MRICKPFTLLAGFEGAAVEDWTGRVVSWSGFLLFHVLPIAVAQIYDWVREWQFLIVAVLVLAFFHFWSRAILRAARQAAREAVQGETRALDATLKLMRRQIEEQAEKERRSAPLPSATVPRGVDGPRPAATPPDSRAAVAHLRHAIRLALGTIPVSDGPLSPDGIRLYRAAIGSLADARIAAEERKGVLAQILTELASLEAAFPPSSCRQAWQALVKVNTLARAFGEPEQPETPPSPAPRRATP
jgi:hypothetical protein